MPRLRKNRQIWKCFPPQAQKRDELEESSGELSALGLTPPQEDDQPIYEPKLSRLAFGKFDKVNIGVDTFRCKPSRVWYLPRAGEKPTIKNQYVVKYLLSDEAISVEKDFKTYQSKWQDIRKNEECDGMNVMMSLLGTYSEAMRFDESISKWHWNDEKSEATIEKLMACEKKHYRMMFQEMQLHTAFVNGMTNDAACNAIRGLFAIASLVAFGEDRGLEIAVTRMVSSSRVKEQSFPLDEVLGGSLISNADEGDEVADDVSYPESEATANATDSSLDQYSVSSFGTSPSPGREKFGDVVVLSGHEPNWPRFLIVAEMKTQGHLSAKHKAQLFREMLGPAMHQSFVFGLLLNDEKAVIFLMYHDSAKKQLFIKDILVYSFFCKEPSFMVTFQHFFVDIVAVLDFAKNNIQEICHEF